MTIEHQVNKALRQHWNTEIEIHHLSLSILFLTPNGISLFQSSLYTPSYWGKTVIYVSDFFSLSFNDSHLFHFKSLTVKFKTLCHKRYFLCIILGLKLTGGAGSKLQGIYVLEIVPGSPASVEGSLQPRDQIVYICGLCTEGISLDDAVRVCEAATQNVQIKATR